MQFDRLLRLVVLLTPAFAGGCMQITYRPLYQPLNQQEAQTWDQQTKSDSLLERRVDFHLAEAFYILAPTCAAIVTKSEGPRAIARLVEDAVERHLATRLSRVIGSAKLRRFEGTLGIDMKAESGRLVFAQQARCGTLVEIQLTQLQDNYLLLWAQRSLTISLTMRSIADEKVLWQARHSAGRADGGLPVSIVDLPISVARAVMVASDPEIFASIADDAARRMMKTLPDIRSTGASLANF